MKLEVKVGRDLKNRVVVIVPIKIEYDTRYPIVNKSARPWIINQGIANNQFYLEGIDNNLREPERKLDEFCIILRGWEIGDTVSMNTVLDILYAGGLLEQYCLTNAEFSSDTILRDKYSISRVVVMELNIDTKKLLQKPLFNSDAIIGNLCRKYFENC